MAEFLFGANFFENRFIFLTVLPNQLPFKLNWNGRVWEGMGGLDRASIGNKNDMGSSPCWESNRKGF